MCFENAKKKKKQNKKKEEKNTQKYSDHEVKHK